MEYSDFMPATEEEKQYRLPERQPSSYFRDGIRRLFRNKVATVSGVILLLVFLCSKASGEMPAEPSVTNEAATNEQRLAFLQSFGWEVSETPTQTQEVRIPEEFKALIGGRQGITLSIFINIGRVRQRRF